MHDDASGAEQPVMAGELPTLPIRPPYARMLAVADVVLASGFPTQLALGALLIAGGLSPYGADGALSMPHIATLLASDTALLLGLIAWRLQAGGERARDVFVGAAPWAREAWRGLLLVPVFIAGTAGLMAALRWAWPWLHNVDANPFEALARSPVNGAILFVLVILSGGLKEECQRAFVLHRFGQHLGGAWLGLAIYSLVFGLGHMIQGYDVGIATALMGVAWGVIFLRRRSVVAPAVSHAGFNAAQIVQFMLLGT